MITVILNGYRRQEYLEEQISCVNSQTAKVDKILIWNNGPNYSLGEHSGRASIANSSENFGVWSRFAFALNAETKYICVLDDDTFPGQRFFETCLRSMKHKPALYGARGLRFQSSTRYHPYESFGWDSPNKFEEVVDIIGHAWFFERDWLSFFWRELPDVGASKFVGEDMHFSHMLQKYGGIPSIVPAHPMGDLSVWGSNPDYASKLGVQEMAISGQPGAFEKFDTALRRNTSRGFKLCNELGIASRSVIVGPALSRSVALRKLIGKNKHIEKIARSLKKKLESFGIYV